ncbi:MAG TPA: peptidoglycan DD-metalloendopeptidase family protein [Methylomirabilota bacterium]|nr:peptidoglycan DD-metalloendopeptidase family protein [Methylomirabilota bacterium]
MGLLIPGLLLHHVPAAHGESKPSKAPAKRVQPGTGDRRAAKPNAAGEGSERRHCVHVVRSGDSVSRVAARYSVTRQSVIAANGLTAPDALRPGQRLEIPGCRSPQPPHAAPAHAPTVRADGTLLARVGPRRVLTRLAFTPPQFGQDAVLFARPVDGPVISAFGKRRSGWHAGVDIRAERGTPVRAAAPGTVYFSGTERAYGKVIKIGHANGFSTVYAHNLDNLARAGDEVETGTVIATVGRSGGSTAYHLHFEIRREGLAYNPLHLLESADAPTVLAGAPEPVEPDEEETRASE